MFKRKHTNESSLWQMVNFHWIWYLIIHISFHIILSTWSVKFPLNCSTPWDLISHRWYECRPTKPLGRWYRNGSVDPLGPGSWNMHSWNVQSVCKKSDTIHKNVARNDLSGKVTKSQVVASLWPHFGQIIFGISFLYSHHPFWTGLSYLWKSCTQTFGSFESILDEGWKGQDANQDDEVHLQVVPCANDESPHRKLSHGIFAHCWGSLPLLLFYCGISILAIIQCFCAYGHSNLPSPSLLPNTATLAAVSPRWEPHLTVGWTVGININGCKVVWLDVFFQLHGRDIDPSVWRRSKS